MKGLNGDKQELQDKIKLLNERVNAFTEAISEIQALRDNVWRSLAILNAELDKWREL